MANFKIALLLIALAAGMASAVPTEIYGYVTDQTHDLPGIQGANVTVECDNQSSTTTSDHKGFYYRMLDCGEQGTITATAQKGSQTGSNSDAPAVSNGFGYAEIGIELSGTEVEVPEYPSAAVPALLSLLSFGLARLRNR